MVCYIIKKSCNLNQNLISFLTLYKMLLLSDLKPGYRAKISAISDELLGSKLMDLGCFVGQNIELTNIAPLGCPIAFKVLDSIVSIRLNDAKNIQVEQLN